MQIARARHRVDFVIDSHLRLPVIESSRPLQIRGSFLIHRAHTTRERASGEVRLNIFLRRSRGVEGFGRVVIFGAARLYYASSETFYE